MKKELRDARNIKRFEDKIFYSPDGCWYWTSDIGYNGYGRFYFEEKAIGAHRFSYQIHKGEVINGLLVCHTCDNRLCVNPDHLFLGTHQDNSDDMMNKQRSAPKHGHHNGNAKLKLETVLLIRQTDGNLSEIADKFNITISQAYKIKNRITWIRY